MAWNPLEFLTSIRDRRDISVAARALLSVLVTYASRRDGACYPTQETLSDALGMTERHLRRVTIELVEAGLLLVRRRGQTSNVYQLRADTHVRSEVASYRTPVSGQEVVRPDTHVRSEPDRTPMSGQKLVQRTPMSGQKLVQRTPMSGVQRTPVSDKLVKDELEGEGARAPALVDLRETDPPASLEITPEVVAQCTMAGAPLPKPEHVVQFLANARQKGLRARSWSAGLVQWMVRQKNYDASRKAQDEGRHREREGSASKHPALFRPPKPDPNERPISPEQFAALQATLGNGPAKVVEPTPARKKTAEGGG